jgi:hypothetical protein
LLSVWHNADYRDTITIIIIITITTIIILLIKNMGLEYNDK